MWLMTKIGFFSIVKKGNEFGKDTWTIRSRSKQDMENLKKFAWLNGEVLTTPEGDYHYRIIINVEELKDIFDKLPESIDYPNFKRMIHANPEQEDKYPFYKGCWEKLWTYQFWTERKKSKEGKKFVEEVA